MVALIEIPHDDLFLMQMHIIQFPMENWIITFKDYAIEIYYT